MTPGGKQARRCFPHRRWALVVLAVIPACGGGDGPTSPSLSAPDPTYVITPGVASVTYEFSWAAQPGATSYLVEIGTSVGASDVLSREVTTTALTTTLPASPGVRDYYLRFRSRGPSGESAPKATFVPAIDLRTIVEALFFETGSLRPPFAPPVIDLIDADLQGFGAFGAGDVMLGWRAGSRVSVIASTALRGPQMQAVRDTVDQFNQAVGGVIHANLVTTADPDPRPRPGTITIAPGDPVEAGCGGNAIGCALRTVEGGVILQARLVVTRSSGGCVSAHEVGHGLYGFGHIILSGVPGIDVPTMSPGGCDLPRMTQAEVDAIEATYERGMRAGARRLDFVRAGLVIP